MNEIRAIARINRSNFKFFLMSKSGFNACGGRNCLAKSFGFGQYVKHTVSCKRFIYDKDYIVCVCASGGSALCGG